MMEPTAYRDQNMVFPPNYLDLKSRALYTHCYGHALNPATQDALKGIKVMLDTLDSFKLIKKSPKRKSIFKKYKDDISTDFPGIRVLCPTHWTVRAKACISINC